MAVRENPYDKWVVNRQNSDYRCTDTQVNSLVKQQLSQPDYLRTQNRVNPGPYRVKRAGIADSSPQVPHVFGPEDMWGWQPWTSDLSQYNSSGLSEHKSSSDIPGKTYLTPGQGGANSY